jgi:hypothetical protein
VNGELGILEGVEHPALSVVLDSSPHLVREPRVDVLLPKAPLGPDPHPRHLVAVEHAVDGLLRDHEVLGKLADGEDVARGERFRHQSLLYHDGQKWTVVDNAHCRPPAASGDSRETNPRSQRPHGHGRADRERHEVPPDPHLRAQTRGVARGRQGARAKDVDDLSCGIVELILTNAALPEATLASILENDYRGSEKIRGVRFVIDG